MTREVPPFNKMIHESHEWLNDIERRLGAEGRQQAYHALRGVFFAVRDRMPQNEVFDLSNQLPTVLRGIFFEGYNPSTSVEKFGPREFLDRVRRETDLVGGPDPEQVTRAVFLTWDRTAKDSPKAAVEKI